MADTFNKKERNKKRQKKKRDKQYKREQKKLSSTKPPEFMYVGEDGNLTTQAPDPSLKKKISIEDIDVSTPKSEKSGESKFVKTGFVKFLNLEKGYGFIIDDESNESYFVHVDSLEGPIRDGDKVVFEAGRGPKGPIAVGVKLQS
ncbi:putative cold-shock DNA-binding protein [Neolewinella xylanilytica]|uniref:Putative cold-shock DNA-binding protein n=1 Tax=Neolewinella xylanilytica TaxID=1514080 RepID=A0A2S6I724_9BACT|nr:cold shock domain-containing protein [Neolewinella xylanilytica]PPK87259.1 putative cold-shock DNA-binding protein [Neolewinella xylanilytica]